MNQVGPRLLVPGSQGSGGYTVRSGQESNLPLSRTGPLMSRLERYGLVGVLLRGLAAYVIIPSATTVVEWLSASLGHSLVISQQGLSVGNPLELLYFNLATILTVGYGDYAPVSYGRVFSVLESIAGMVLFGLLIAVATIRVLQPPKNAIVFSEYAYYCLDRERFLVVFVNTTSSVLITPELCSYYRIGDDWTVCPADRVPFIRQSVWTYFVDSVPLEKLHAGSLLENSLRFGVTGQLGLGTVSAYAEYTPDHILVLPNATALTTFAGFRHADLADLKVREMFDYRPADATTLLDYVQVTEAEALGSSA